jgi:hypothetical protein
MLVTDSNLHSLTWTPNNTSAGIDNTLAQEIEMVSSSDYMTMSIADTRGDAGALCSLNRPVPIVDGLPLPYLRALWGIRPSRTATKQNRVYETAAILVFPPSLDGSPVPSQWFDGSFQANQVQKAFQIDYVAVPPDATGKLKYGWKNTNVTAGALYQPDVWNPLQIDYLFDFAGKTTSVYSINGTAVDSVLLKVPANLNNWSRNVAGMPHQPLLKLQTQAHLLVPGAFEIDYTISLFWSDNPSFN